MIQTMVLDNMPSDTCVIKWVLSIFVKKNHVPSNYNLGWVHIEVQVQEIWVPKHTFMDPHMSII
jgi:hypothetical protein